MNLHPLKKYIQALLPLVLLMGVFQKTMARHGTDKTKELLVRVQRAYQRASYLEFQVEYFYANKRSPRLRIDSLFGNVQMDKNRCRFVIDNTETVVTGKYTIQVLKPEKTIYLSPSRHSGMMDPMGVMDSLLAHMDGVHTEIREADGTETLTISFPPGRMYTRITLVLDPKSAFLKRVTYDLHTASLVGEEMVESPGHPGPYQSEGQVDVIFSGYHTGSFDEAQFDEKKFFKRVADHFEPSEQFKGYHILLASNNH